MRSFTQTQERPFSIGAQQTEIRDAPERWAALFAEERAIVCPDLFEPALFARIMDTARAASFRADAVPELGMRQVAEPDRVGNMVALLLQRPVLLRWLERVSGRAGLAGFEGRLVKTHVGGEALDWHNDLQGPRRALGITICLTETPYTGGLFEMRAVDDPSTARAFAHTQPGTALIFDVAGDIEHCVHPVTAGGPRCVLTGWFLRERALPSPFA